MENYIKKISAKRIHGRLNLDLEFNSSINIIHAENGAGKTTLLHILANALNFNFIRFAYLNFESIEISYTSGDNIVLVQERSPKRNLLSAYINNQPLLDKIPLAEFRHFSPEGYSYRNKKYTKSKAQQLSLFEDTLLSQPSINSENLVRASYFPAFRTMIEAWSHDDIRREIYYRREIEDSRYMEELQREIQKEIQLASLPDENIEYPILYTYEARKAFGQFVPLINYSSPSQIANNLKDQIRKALLDIATKDRELLSSVFIDVFNSLSQTDLGESESPEEILREIETAISDNNESPYNLPIRQGDVYEKLRRAIKSAELDTKTNSFTVPILDVYRKSLQERVQVQRDAFKNIEVYLNSVNEFLKDKELVITPDSRPNGSTVSIKFSDGKMISGLRALSSGERQIVTLVYAATRMSSQEVVLIDEPEISLHIDWQRSLLQKMFDQLGQRQIIVCTHSPSIGADFLDSMVELKPTYSESLDNVFEIFDNEDQIY